MSVRSEVSWNLDLLNAWGEPTMLEVTREKIAAYAQATNDEHPAHRSGDLAPPVFPVVGALVEAIVPNMLAMAPEEWRTRIVHGEQDFRYHQPIVPGMKLVTRGAPIGVRGASTGVVVLGKGVTETESGDPVVDQYVTLFFRGAQLDAQEGESVAKHTLDSALRDQTPDAQVTQRFDSDQTQRYSAASGDLMPIHLDDAAARKVGLPGIIVHGLCTMAFCSRAVVDIFCADDPTRLRRLAVRFTNIVQPSEAITTSLWAAGSGRAAFETVSDNGKTAIKDGLAEIDG